MKILPINIVNQNKNNGVQSRSKNNISASSRNLSCDTVTFKSKFYPPKFEKTLYRAIGKEELLVLLNGLRSNGSKYVTSDPRGYNASSWDNGFRSGQKEVFFIKFKKNHFDEHIITDRRDNKDCSRYIIQFGYSLDDIESIHKGHCANGEIVWASSSEIVENDKKNKLLRIIALLKELDKDLDEEHFGQKVAELSTFVQEFPEIITVLKQKQDSKKFISPLLYLISKSEDEKHYNFIKNYLINFNHMPENNSINNFALEYFINFAKKEDLDLILQTFQNDNERGKHSYSYLIANIVNKQELPKLERAFNSSDFTVQKIALRTYELLDAKNITQNKALETCEKILNQLLKYKEEDYLGNNELYDLIFVCTNILDSNENYLRANKSLLEKFTNLNLGTDPDFRFYVKQLNNLEK